MLRFFRAIFSVLGDIERICSVFSADFKPIFYSQVGGLDRSEWVDMLRFRHYMLNQWQTYENIMKSGLPEVSNNLCEQRMKPLKLSMKNSQNIGSEEAAKGHCLIHSLLESCRRLGVSIYDYLVALFRRLPDTPKDQRKQLLPHILGPLLPKQELIPIFSRSYP